MGRMVFLTHNGQTLSIAAWARQLGLRPGTLHNRLQEGMPQERALTLPHQPQIQQGVTQWCEAHEQALIRNIQGETEWHSLPRSLLIYAQKIAAACDCAHQITVTHVACPQCQVREEAA